MTLNTVTLTWDITDLGQDTLAGRISLTPTAVLTDPTDKIVVPSVIPKSQAFVSGTGSMPGIIATDNEQVTPSGWAYVIQIVSQSGQTIVGPFTAFIPYSNGATQDLSQLVPVQTAATYQAYLPVPTGTPAEGDVPVATGTGNATEWGTAGGGGGISPPAGDLGGTALAPTVVSTHLSEPLPVAQGGTGSSTQVWDNEGAATAAQTAAESFATAAVATETSRAETAETLAALKANNLSDLASVSQARTNLGLGSAATMAASAFDAAGAASTAQANAEAYALPHAGGDMTGWLAPSVIPLSQSAGTVAVNAALGNVYTLTLTASGWAIANPTSPTDGQVIRFRLTQDSTGGRTVTWGTAYDWGSGNSAPALSTTANKTDVLGFEYNAGTSMWMYLAAPFPQGF